MLLQAATSSCSCRCSRCSRASSTTRPFPSRWRCLAAATGSAPPTPTSPSSTCAPTRCALRFFAGCIAQSAELQSRPISMPAVGIGSNSENGALGLCLQRVSFALAHGYGFATNPVASFCCTAASHCCILANAPRLGCQTPGRMAGQAACPEAYSSRLSVSAGPHPTSRQVPHEIDASSDRLDWIISRRRALRRTAAG